MSAQRRVVRTPQRLDAPLVAALGSVSFQRTAGNAASQNSLAKPDFSDRYLRHARTAPSVCGLRKGKDRTRSGHWAGEIEAQALTLMPFRRSSTDARNLAKCINSRARAIWACFGEPQQLRLRRFSEWSILTLHAAATARLSCVERPFVAREKINDAALVGCKPCVRPSLGGAYGRRP
jgi:hypothetical protein